MDGLKRCEIAPERSSLMASWQEAVASRKAPDGVGITHHQQRHGVLIQEAENGEQVNTGLPRIGLDPDSGWEAGLDSRGVRK
jgi:hypothetical protein